MRFLLNPRRPRAANLSRPSASSPKKAAAAARTELDTSAGKAWGQRCSPECGCVVRVEARLSERPSAASPTIVEASYHAKRVVGTSLATDGGGRLWTPLATRHRSLPPRPILTECTCPALHHMAQRAVERMEGRTLAQMRNEVDCAGGAGSRSPIALRHTVLRETVLPALRAAAGKDPTAAGALSTRCAADADGDDGADTVESTRRHGHCYDLVEESLLSLFLGRVPGPRRETEAGSYSPTLGGTFAMYGWSGGDGRADYGDARGDGIDGGREDERESLREAGDWRRRSPASYLLFGDEYGGSRPDADRGGSGSLTGIFFEHLSELARGSIAGGPGKSSEETENNSIEDRRPMTTYLQLLDMYGDRRDEGEEEADDNASDWLEYVDQMHRRA